MLAEERLRADAQVPGSLAAGGPFAGAGDLKRRG